MTNSTMTERRSELAQLCAAVRALVAEEDYQTPAELVSRAMARHPHAPQPHNLMGIILEKTGDHLTAMKHFQAARALDPCYPPANHNLYTYGTFFSGGSCAFDESDVPSAPPCGCGLNGGRTATAAGLGGEPMRAERSALRSGSSSCIDGIGDVMPAGKGGVKIVEAHIHGGSPVKGKRLWEIPLPREAIVGCILRADTALVPRGDTRIQAGDTLIVITANDQELKTVSILMGS